MVSGPRLAPSTSFPDEIADRQIHILNEGSYAWARDVTTTQC